MWYDSSAIKLFWTLSVSGAVIALGLALVSRWLSTAGVPMPIRAIRVPECKTEIPARETAEVFGAALLFRLAIFVGLTVLFCVILYPGSGLDTAIQLWKKWDAWHYINLAELGYYGYTEEGQHLFVVFFPLYPWLVRLVSSITGNTMVAGLSVSFLCYAGGCVYFYRLVAWDYGRPAARRALLFLSVFPYAFFFGGVMTESLFFLTTAGALWYIRRHKWLPAGILGMLAAMTRMHGLLLIGAAAAELVENMGRLDWKVILRRLPTLLLPALGTLVYLWLNASVTGDPFGFVQMQEHWSQGFCWISDTLWYVLQNAISFHTPEVRYEIWIPTILLFPLFFGLLVGACRRFRSMYTLYGFVYLILNYSLSWLLSAGRYLSCALPFFLFAAVWTEKRPVVTAVLTAAMAGGFLINLFLYLSGGQIM
ncbi:glycosyltransferase family 39 protein [Flavonifractor hominis]|uniref:Glycosyltransferase family 39 protein n=1 Tax=Flavonifractor hominis TaxID=3133178 RepID=A0ABV1EKP4_9FIRM